MLIDLTLFGHLDQPITGKMYKKEHAQPLCMLLYGTLQSLFAKLVQTAIMHQYRNVHPKDSLYEEDLPIPDALKPPCCSYQLEIFREYAQFSF